MSFLEMPNMTGKAVIIIDNRNCDLKKTKTWAKTKNKKQMLALHHALLVERNNRQTLFFLMKKKKKKGKKKI